MVKAVDSIGDFFDAMARSQLSPAVRDEGNKGTALLPKEQVPDTNVPKKATLMQVVATMFWGLCMIGKKGTWERDGAKITLKQAVIGALVAGCVVVTFLVLLARFAVR